LGQGLENVGELMGDSIRERKQIKKRNETSKKILDLMGRSAEKNPSVRALMGDFDPEDISGNQATQMVDALMGAAQVGTQFQRWDVQKLMGEQTRREMDAPPWQPSAVDLMGDGTPDGVMTSRNSYQHFKTKDPEEQPLYPWKEGMPSRMLLDEGVVGMVDPVRKYFRPHAIEMKKVYGIVPGTNKYGEYMAPNYDTTGLKLYKDWKPENPTTPTDQAVDAKTIVGQVKAEHPEWTREQIIAESRRIAGQ